MVHPFNLVGLLTSKTCQKGNLSCEEDPQVTAQKAMSKAGEQPLQQETRRKKPASTNRDTAAIIEKVQKSAGVPAPTKSSAASAATAASSEPENENEAVVGAELL